ncbi:MAG: hypothetical protein CMO55_18630 [Verrucomicrobiales bacterium]|nr:hypothetical protein [Verrucomicrobiales bacterium]
MSRKAYPLFLALSFVGICVALVFYKTERDQAISAETSASEQAAASLSTESQPAGEEISSPEAPKAIEPGTVDDSTAAQKSTRTSDEKHKSVTISDQAAQAKADQIRFSGITGADTAISIPKSVIEDLFHLSPGDELTIPLEQPLTGIVTHNTIHETGGRGFGIALQDFAGAHFSIEQDPEGEISGNILQSRNTDGYKASEDDSGENVLIAKTLTSNIVCTRIHEDSGKLGLDPALEEVDADAVASADDPEMVIPDLQSRPGARRVIYLDFDGEVVQGTGWVNGGRIDALPYENQNNIPGIFATMSEDFAPFNVNVTTIRSVFDAAPTDSRCMVIFTPTNDAAPGAGGVAFLNSFGSSVNYMCWVFNRGLNGAAEAGSHEVGHQVGLRHDGTSSRTYYGGHTHTATGVEWGPIMGASYGQNIVQWSQGEYIDANQQEDDFVKIVDDLPYLTDDHGNSLGTATNIPTDISQTFSQTGIIERRNDVDVFRIDINDDGTITASADPASTYRNLDVSLELLDASGNTLDSDAPAGPYDASVSASGLAVGTYYLRVTSSGLGATGFSENGYNTYGSRGRYTLTGTYPFLLIPDVPAGLSATDGTSTENVFVSWNSTEDTDGYRLYRNTVDSEAGATLVADVTGTSYTDTTALHNVTYYYFISAYNTQGESALSLSETGFRRLPPPQVPNAVSASDGSSTSYVRISWAIANYAYSYEIWRNSVNSTSGASMIATTSSTSYDDTTTPAGEIFYYFVRAVNPEATSAYSNGNSGYKDIPPPATPTGVVASDGISNQYTEVSWSSVALAAGYYVLRNTTNSAAGGTLVAQVDSSITSIQDFGGAGGVVYYYFVRAFNENGNSNFSASNTGYRLVAPPTTPTNVTATRAEFENAIRVDWAETSETTQYYVYRSSENDPDTAILREKVTNNRYYDPDALPGRVYYYFIRSENSAGTSALSLGALGFVAAADPEDDAYENNDVFEFAQPITRAENEWLSEFDGPGFSRDADWFCFELDPTSDQIDVILSTEFTAEIVGLDLYDESGNLLDSGAEGANSFVTISYEGATPGATYYVAVTTSDYAGLEYDLIWKSIDPGESDAVVDEMIGFSSTRQIGDGVVNESAAAQTITSISKSRRTHKAYFTIENESAGTQKYYTGGNGGSRFFSVTYLQLINGTWQNATGDVIRHTAESNLQPFESSDFQVFVRPGKFNKTRTKYHFVVLKTELESFPDVVDTNRLNVIKQGKKKKRKRRKKRR